ncbi:hypothetical protein B0T24DRAFT_365750 [Lasiosphaeria ovina]|uniref:DUF7907 domain-containing protein n=1 Tax=Lasiosphaeria ovina TaxID=92902 RepID=A0AAE0N4C9_9PEZI|nr:hypothetical protein B0T24DRAFT_365750 [Lasiosphaeria ovina]
MLSATFLALATLAAASPITPRQSGNAPFTWGKAYSLVVNVTDISTDFQSNPVHGLKVVGVHAGAGLNSPTVTFNPESHGDVFFNSLTDHTVRLSGGTPSLPPIGVKLYDNNPSAGNPPFLHELGFNFGNGTWGFGASAGPLNPRPCPQLWAPLEGTFVVCDRGIEAPTYPRFAVQFVEGQANSGTHKWYQPEPHVPANCVAVKLVPKCATPSENDGKSSNGDVEAENVQCYPDVGAIQWAEYSECW